MADGAARAVSRAAPSEATLSGPSLSHLGGISMYLPALLILNR
jgi:hypothetical protein